MWQVCRGGVEVMLCTAHRDFVLVKGSCDQAILIPFNEVDHKHNYKHIMSTRLLSSVLNSLYVRTSIGLNIVLSQ